MTRPVVEGGPAVVCLGETMAQIVPIDGLRLHEASACAFGVAGAESNVAISSRGWAQPRSGPDSSETTRWVSVSLANSVGTAW